MTDAAMETIGLTAKNCVTFSYSPCFWTSGIMSATGMSTFHGLMLPYHPSRLPIAWMYPLSESGRPSRSARRDISFHPRTHIAASHGLRTARRAYAGIARLIQ